MTCYALNDCSTAIVVADLDDLAAIHTHVEIVRPCGLAAVLSTVVWHQAGSTAGLGRILFCQQSCQDGAVDLIPSKSPLGIGSSKPLGYELTFETLHGIAPSLLIKSVKMFRGVNSHDMPWNVAGPPFLIHSSTRLGGSHPDD